MNKLFLFQTLIFASISLVVLPKVADFDHTPIDPIYHTQVQSKTVSNKAVWLNFNELEKKLQEDPKPVLVDVYTDWCGWCKKMDATTFRDEKVVETLNESYYAVKLNAESEEVITFEGKQQPMFALARKMGVSGFPTVVLLNTQKKESKMLVGYQKAGAMHKQLVKFID